MASGYDGSVLVVGKNTGKLRGLLFQQPVEGALWVVGDYQPLFLRAALRRFALGFRSLAHGVILKESPGRGSDPDDLEGQPLAGRPCLPVPAPGDTDAQTRLDVGAGGGSSSRPAPTWFGPSSAAHEVS